MTTPAFKPRKQLLDLNRNTHTGILDETTISLFGFIRCDVAVPIDGRKLGTLARPDGKRRGDKRKATGSVEQYKECEMEGGYSGTRFRVTGDLGETCLRRYGGSSRQRPNW